MLDTVGAATGPVIAFAVLLLVPEGYRTVFVVSLAFALLHWSYSPTAHSVAPRNNPPAPLSAAPKPLSAAPKPLGDTSATGPRPLPAQQLSLGHLLPRSHSMRLDWFER